VLNLDPGKLLVIAVVAIILLGPDKLPKVAHQVGGAWRSFNDFRQRMETEVRSSILDLPSTSDLARLARSPSAMLSHLSNMSSDGEESNAADGASSLGGEASTPDIVVPTIPGVYAGPPSAHSTLPELAEDIVVPPIPGVYFGPSQESPPCPISRRAPEAMASGDPNQN
jgi:Sec-independent protein translocase protein TatA